MNKTWFDKYMTGEEIKNEYRRLCKIHHPDMGGNTATMQAINAAYAIASANATRREKPDWTEAQYIDAAQVAEAIRAAIEAVITLEGLNIEVCGLWVWVDGDTRTHKDALKAAGYKWASKKLKWYYAGIPSNGRGKWSMRDIRAHYGSQKVQQDDDQPRRRRPAPALA